MNQAQAESTTLTTNFASVSPWVRIWRFRELLISLVVRDIKVKYQRSFLGLAWTLINPLLTLAILITVFSLVVRIRIPQYWAFLISGFFVWNYFQQTLFLATSILRDNASLNRSANFPREILIIGAAVSKLIEFLIEMTLAAAVLILFHHQAVPAGMILLPVVILMQFVMAVSLMFPLAIFAVLFQDVQQALPIVIMSLFYLSPVFYPIDMVPEALRPIFYLNPLTCFLKAFHVILYDGNWPSIALMAGMAAGCAGMLLVGYWIFDRYRETCVEIA